MISIPLILWLWFAHWVGDFVFQTDEQARGKSTSNEWLSDHVLNYTAALAIGLMIYSWVFPPMNPAGATLFLALNGALHWLTDYVTSRYNARMWREGRVHDFFVGVGADQMAHLWTLVLSASWLIGA